MKWKWYVVPISSGEDIHYKIGTDKLKKLAELEEMLIGEGEGVNRPARQSNYQKQLEQQG